MIKLYAKLTVFLILMVLLPPQLKPVTDQDIIYLRSSDSTTLDPGKTSDYYSSEVITNIFEGLVRYKKETTEIEPCLATDWQVAEDGLTWTFKLRKGVLFHNGESLNSSAVVNSFKTRMARDPDSDYKKWYLLYSYISDIKAIDDYIVEFLLSRPYTPFLNSLANPKAAITAPGSYTNENFSPIGTGPFKFARWEKNRFLIINRNPSYWEGEVKIGRIIFKVVEDTSWRFLQLRNGKADAAIISSSKEYEEVRGASNIRILSYPSLTTHYLAFNTKKKPFDKVKVRKAFAHLIGKEPLIRHIFQDFARNATTPVPAHILKPDPEIRDYPFDLSQAKLLLKEAGYQNGFRVKIYFSNSFTPLEGIAAALKRSAKKVKINIQRVALPFIKLREAIDQKKHDMVMIGWSGEIPDPDSFLYPLFMMKRGHSNRSFYENPQLTQLIEKARTVVQPQLRRKLYSQALKIIHRDVPWIPLFNLNLLLATNTRVKNLYFNQLSHLIFKDATPESK